MDRRNSSQILNFIKTRPIHVLNIYFLSLFLHNDEYYFVSPPPTCRHFLTLIGIFSTVWSRDTWFRLYHSTPNTRTGYRVVGEFLVSTRVFLIKYCIRKKSHSHVSWLLDDQKHGPAFLSVCLPVGLLARYRPEEIRLRIPDLVQLR